VYNPPVSLLPRISVIVSLRLNFEMGPASRFLAMGKVTIASVQELRAATARIADAVGDFILVYFLWRKLRDAVQNAIELKMSKKRNQHQEAIFL
jgi:hypothetical protein